MLCWPKAIKFSWLIADVSDFPQKPSGVAGTQQIERERESVAAVLKNVLLHNPHRKSNIGEGSNVNPVFRLAMDAISSVCIDGLSQERILKTR